MSRRSALISLVVTVAIAWGALVATQANGITPLLGLDLQGGFSVVLEAPEDVAPEVLEKAVEIMRRRIEALGNVQEPEIAVLGANQIEVQLPGVTDRERALAAVGRTGQLEFRPVLAVSPIARIPAKTRRRSSTCRPRPPRVRRRSRRRPRRSPTPPRPRSSIPRRA